MPHFVSHNASALAHGYGWGWSERVVDEAAAVAARGYRTVASEVEGLERSWKWSDFLLRRGLSVKSGAEQEQGKVGEKVVEFVEAGSNGTVEKAKKVGRPRKVEDDVEKAKTSRRRPRATMKKLEEEIAANEAASGSGIPPMKLKLTTRKRRSAAVARSAASADSGELAVSSLDDPRFDVGVASQLSEGVSELGSEDGFRGQGSSALTGDTLNFKAGGESSSAILSSLVEEGESQVETGHGRGVFPPLKPLKGVVQSGMGREAVDGPPRTAPKFPKPDLTSKQRITRLELDGDDNGKERGANVVLPDQYVDPKEVFLMLHHARPGNYTSAEKARLSWIFHRFAESGLVRLSVAGLH